MRAAGTSSSQLRAGQPTDTGQVLESVYRTLLAHYGPQRWWPTISGSRWEVMMGAVLVQRTNWRNADRALANLRVALGVEVLSNPSAILGTAEESLMEMLRPAGHFSRKSRTLKLLARLVVELGGADAISASSEGTAQLRARLLGVWGIGPETADAILLYALDRPVFVADAYALRLGSRWGLFGPAADYEEVQRTFSDNLRQDVAMFNEYHALVVEHGKQICRPTPRCDLCPLNRPISIDATVSDASWRCPRRLIASADASL